MSPTVDKAAHVPPTESCAMTATQCATYNCTSALFDKKVNKGIELAQIKMVQFLATATILLSWGSTKSSMGSNETHLYDKNLKIKTICCCLHHGEDPKPAHLWSLLPAVSSINISRLVQ